MRRRIKRFITRLTMRMNLPFGACPTGLMMSVHSSSSWRITCAFMFCWCICVCLRWQLPMLLDTMLLLCCVHAIAQMFVKWGWKNTTPKDGEANVCSTAGAGRKHQLCQEDAARRWPAKSVESKHLWSGLWQQDGTQKGNLGIRQETNRLRLITCGTCVFLEPVRK